MTGLRIFSRTTWVLLCGAAALTAFAFLACGGPTPIPGSSAVVSTNGQRGTGTGVSLATSGSTSTSTDDNPTPTDVDGGNCGITTNSLTQQPADLLLVLDRSGSMNDDIASNSSCTGANAPANCTARWPTMTTALNQVLAASPAGVEWGLKFFTSPGGGNCTVNPGVEVAVGPNTAAQIQAAIAGTSPGSQTPTTAAINAAVAYYGTVTDGRSHFILLATDGQPNCDPGTTSTVSDASVADAAGAIATAYSAGIKTYVIGIGPSAGNLTSFAAAGGTTDFFPATSPDQLTAALSNIATAVASCVFNLGKVPPDPTNVVVEFNGDSNLRAPYDPTQTNGWNYTSSADTSIQLYGSWCTDVTNGTYKSAEVLMGCGTVRL
ncbi:MAG: vWA domain-containing protein [Polyangia bacterium]